MKVATLLQQQNDEDFDYLIIAKIRNSVADTRMVSLHAASKFLGITKKALYVRTQNAYKHLQMEESDRGWLLQVGELVRLRSMLDVIARSKAATLDSSDRVE